MIYIQSNKIIIVISKHWKKNFFYKKKRKFKWETLKLNVDEGINDI